VSCAIALGVRIALGALVAVALGGCAALGTNGGSTTARPAIAQAQRTHEFATPARSAPVARGGRISATTAVRAFATEYVNWDAASVVAHLRLLAAASVGQARSAMQLAAAQAARDYELRRGGVANHGAVEAIAPLTQSRDQYVVITRESTTASASTAYRGLRPAWHVALATVVQLRGGAWVLSGWQPES
jgi:hypothetical protein